MSFDWQAFATGFLETTADIIKERKQEASKYEERQRQLAERNMSVISKRRAVANQVISLTNMLRDNGASPAVIQAAVAAGPKAVADLAAKVEQTAQQYGRKLSSDDIETLVRIPEGFSAIDMDTEEFVKKTYGLGYAGAGVTEVKPERTFMDRLTGRKYKDMARYRLDSEVMDGGLTAYDINQMAAQSDYESLVPGTFITFTDAKVFNPATDMGSFTRTFSNLVQDVEDSATFKSIESTRRQVAMDVNISEEDRAVRLNALDDQRRNLYLRTVSPTIEAMVSTYGDSFIDATEGYLRGYLGDEYVNRLSSRTSDEEEPEVQRVNVQTEAILDEGITGMGEPSTAAAGDTAEEGPSGPRTEMPEVRQLNIEDYPDQEAMLKQYGTDLMQYMKDMGVQSEEEMVIAMAEWAQQNKKTMPMDKSLIVYALKPYVLGD